MAKRWQICLLISASLFFIFTFFYTITDSLLSKDKSKILSDLPKTSTVKPLTSLQLQLLKTNKDRESQLRYFCQHIELFQFQHLQIQARKKQQYTLRFQARYLSLLRWLYWLQNSETPIIFDKFIVSKKQKSILLSVGISMGFST